MLMLYQWNGRRWSSQSGENILMSCSWVYSQAPKDLSGLSLALSVVLAEALYDEYGVEINVKWPNDILVNGKKLAGILLDVSVGVSCHITIGLGLNVAQSGDFDVDQPWTDLASQGLVNVDRNKLIAIIFSRWVSLLKRYSELGFESYKKRWCLLAEYINKKVILKHKSLDDPSQLIGVFKGVDDQGQLLIDVGGDLTMVSDSEYSMRVAQDQL